MSTKLLEEKLHAQLVNKMYEIQTFFDQIAQHKDLDSVKLQILEKKSYKAKQQHKNIVYIIIKFIMEYESLQIYFQKCHQNNTTYELIQNNQIKDYKRYNCQHQESLRFYINQKKYFICEFKYCRTLILQLNLKLLIQTRINKNHLF
ncbi:unnamed protein product [Paramecium pentaurelia]|uniref:Uncharacterized protein n=1 Tax=Paramecium pentaurelia TaxID=43138 RepID=A0A8S1Y2V5_9CILI|nr:unnamed protein product [Paramecium pentaurelia]